MAKKKKKTTRTAREKGTLPGTLTAVRVSEALKAIGVSQKNFLEAYDETAGQRGVGNPGKEALSAFKDYEKSGEFKEFMSETKTNSQQATNLLSRCIRFNAEN